MIITIYETSNYYCKKIWLVFIHTKIFIGDPLLIPNWRSNWYNRVFSWWNLQFSQYIFNVTHVKNTKTQKPNSTHLRLCSTLLMKSRVTLKSILHNILKTSCARGIRWRACSSNGDSWFNRRRDKPTSLPAVNAQSVQKQ